MNTNANIAWRPAPVIRFSLLLHGAAAIAAATQPATLPWALGAVAANHALLSAAVLWPKGRALGPNIVRLPEAAAERGEISLTFDDGPDPVVTPRVLDLLDYYQAKASFFCIAEKAAASPDVVREIIRRGHSVENHTYRHSHAFAFFGMARLRSEVETAQTTIADITGRLPEFFRAPAGFRSPLLDPVLAKRGLRYISWTRRALDGTQGNAMRALRRLTRGLAAGDVLLMHDGSRVRTKEGESVVLSILPLLLEEMTGMGLKSVSLPMAFRNEHV